jgi:predicted DNA-binding protein
MNIIEGIQEQNNRVRELIELYLSVPNGQFAAAMMKAAIQEGEAAIASADTVRMIAAYKDLEEFHD